MWHNSRLNLQKITLTCMLCMTIFLFVPACEAATIYLSPAQPQIVAGQTQTFRVLVNTQSVAINNAEGVIAFDPSVIQVLSINRTGSVMNLWIEEPTFSNTTGIISFNGGAVTPGYTGSAGLLFSVVVRAKTEGSAIFKFQDVSIRQNDGSGTDVLSATANSSITVVASGADAVKPKPEPEATVAVIAKTVEPSTAIAKPILTSTTHPNPSAWYSSRDVDVFWAKSSTAPGVQVLFNSTPGSAASGPILYGVTTKALRGVRDGVSYMHVRYVSSVGVSETTHYAIHVDRISPDGIGIEATSGVITVTANDQHSGIDYANITIDNGTSTKVAAVNGVISYAIPSDIVPGTHEITAEVFDRAGNSAIDTRTVNISEIRKNDIAVTEDEVGLGAQITVKGDTSVRDGKVILSVTYPDQKISQFSVNTDTDGIFEFSVLGDQAGTYVIWADSQVAGRSNMVDVVVRTTFVYQALQWLRENGLLLVILLLLAWVFSLHRKVSPRKSAVKDLKQIHEIELDIAKSVKELKIEAGKQIEYLDRLAKMRALTTIEKARYTKYKGLLG